MKKIFSHFFKKDPYPDGIDGFDWHENQPRWPLVRIMNTALTIISIIVWVVLLSRLFVFNSGKFDNMILLDEKAAGIYPEKTSQILRIHSNTEEDGKSGLVVLYPVYLEEAENLQLTAQINRRVLKPGEGDTPYTFILRESDGTKSSFYPLSFSKTQKKMNYTFYRIGFNGVELDQNKVYTLLVYCGKVEGKESEYSAKDADFTFTILNSETYCNTITPEKDVFVVK